MLRDKLASVFNRERLAAMAAPERLRYVSLGVVGLLVVGAALIGVLNSSGDPTPASAAVGADQRAVEDQANRGLDRTDPSTAPVPTPSDTPSTSPSESKPTPEKATEEPKGEPKKTDSGGNGDSNVNIPADCSNLSGNRKIGCAVMLDYGFGMDQWSCLNTLWDHESGWNTHAENPSSGAYGIPQALPGSKMGTAGSDWQNSAATQVKWGLGYIKGRYSTPCGAWGFWQSNNWY